MANPTGNNQYTKGGGGYSRTGPLRKAKGSSLLKAGTGISTDIAHAKATIRAAGVKGKAPVSRALKRVSTAYAPSVGMSRARSANSFSPAVLRGMSRKYK